MALREAIDRNGLNPTSLASNADVARRAGAWMDTDESVAYMRPQIELAAELLPIAARDRGVARAQVVGSWIHAPVNVL